MILAAPRNAGNGSHGLARRIPLALLAYEHARSRYRLDPERVYVGGFSGGSRIALTVAIAYADVFRGAFLVAGSSDVGAQGPTPPSRDVMAPLQSRTRMAFVTGERDRGALDRDRRSERALREYCVMNLASFVQRRRGHQLPDGHGLAEGLDFLDAPSSGTASLAQCRSRLAGEVAAALDAVADLAAAGRTAEAGEQLSAIDRRYGGLAAPRSIDLAHCLLRPGRCTGTASP
jgi:pimeloyl-ACP methyl ester carboxylesterase